MRAQIEADIIGLSFSDEIMVESESDGGSKALAETASLWSRFKGLLERSPRFLAYAIVAVPIVLVLLVVIPAYQFLKQFNDAVDILTDKYGINTLLAKALAAVLFVPLAVGAKRALFEFGGRGVRARLATGAYAAAYFLALYAVGRNASFSHKTGEVLQWYAETPEGVRFFDSPGYDTKYGLPLRPVTPEMKVALARRQLGQVPSSVPVTDLAKLELFDPLTGAPRYWFFKSAAGEFELFDGPGFHPQNQQLLVALNAHAVSEVNQWLQAKEAEAVEASRSAFVNRYIDRATRGTAGIKQWAVLITNAANDIVPGLVAAGNDALARKGIRSVTPFRPQFLRDKINDQLFGGDASLVHRLSLEQFCDGLVLGKVRVTLSTSAEVQGMSTARASLLVRFVSTSTGGVVGEFEVHALGAGFLVEAAQSQAMDRLADGLKNRLVVEFPSSRKDPP